MFTLICARINGWVNNREAGDLRRYRAHYDVIVMNLKFPITTELRYIDPLPRHTTSAISSKYTYVYIYVYIYMNVYICTLFRTFLFMSHFHRMSEAIGENVTYTSLSFIGLYLNPNPAVCNWRNRQIGKHRYIRTALMQCRSDDAIHS